MLVDQVNYPVAWGVYLVSVAGVLWLFWLMIRFVLPASSTRLILLLSAAFLLVPSQLGSEGGDWAPAFMTVLMEFLEYGPDKALQRLWPILLAMLAMLACALFSTVASVIIRARRTSQPDRP